MRRRIAALVDEIHFSLLLVVPAGTQQITLRSRLLCHPLSRLTGLRRQTHQGN
jgi:hypothetical protein